MRPVDRGPSPGSFSDYSDAIGHLEDRLGVYCSYCERRLPASLAVEHMAPKSLHPDRELEWENFLLACTNCNSTKGSTDVQDNEMLWPDRDNTMLAIEYLSGGFVNIAAGLSEDVTSRCKRLIELVGLDRHQVDGWPDPTGRDKRWKQREEVWVLAEWCLEKFEAAGGEDAARELVTVAAAGYGFFSIWMQIFRDHPAVCLSLIEVFEGTATECFDLEGHPMTRKNGVI
jgi:uncharacterized protein (TIGR02646 family)